MRCIGVERKIELWPPNPRMSEAGALLVKTIRLVTARCWTSFPCSHHASDRPSA
jgi:hypothetical protein